MDKRDDFWDISKLSPSAKKPQPRFRTEPAVSTLEIAGDKQEGDLRITLPRGGENEEMTYSSLSNPLIKRITIRRFKGGYDFYESFRKAALLYYDVASEETPFVSFYSYMPQYSQMSAEQKNYYFYLRSCIRAGDYSKKADLSYLYLYVYEILNLPEKIPANKGIVQLCELWRHYRKSLPAIDRYFSVWVQDYCIVHQLEAPSFLIEDFIYDIIDATSFKEFYLGGVYSKSRGEITALLSCLSDYDWRTGRYAGGEGREAYQKHIEGAMLSVLRSLWEKGALLSEDAAVETLRRDAFPCSLCTHSVKCRIEIEYYPLGRSDALRNRVTSALKYTENCLRSAMSVKSRLAVKHLAEEDKQLIDAYFADIFKLVNQKRREAQRESYEALYDAPRQEMSFSGADAIEQSSWQNTYRLVDSEEPYKEEVAVVKQESEAAIAFEDTNPQNEAEAENALVVNYLRAILSGDRDACKSALVALDAPEETVAEQINGIFTEIMGDIVLEITESGIVLIEDYREDVEAWLNTPK